MKRILYSLLAVVVLVLLPSCKQQDTPKPRAYFRIALPAKEYHPLGSGFPYSFELPTYAIIKPYSGKWNGSDTAAYWINLEFPQFKGRLHLTYKTVDRNLGALIEDAHAFAFKHSVKADAINQKEYMNASSKVFGVLFDIKGNTASSVQFYMTDSIQNFLRGALYFDVEPNKDSLAPVKEFLRKDVEHLIETLTWKNSF